MKFFYFFLSVTCKSSSFDAASTNQGTPTDLGWGFLWPKWRNLAKSLGSQRSVEVDPIRTGFSAGDARQGLGTEPVDDEDG